MGSAVLALDAELDLKETALGYGPRVSSETAKPECIVCFACVQVKDNRKFPLAPSGVDFSHLFLAQHRLFERAMFAPLPNHNDTQSAAGDPPASWNWKWAINNQRVINDPVIWVTDGWVFNPRLVSAPETRDAAVATEED